MKTEHTPEPLHYMPLPAADGTFMVLGGQGQDYGLVASCTTEEDARRIVACVNACAGMTNEQIDNVCMISGSLLNRFGEQMAYLGQVEKQRDELLAALEFARQGYQAASENGDPDEVEWAEMYLRSIDTAIASVKEKA